MSENTYKLYQLMEYFTKHAYENVFIKNLMKDDELWLFNKNNSCFNLIRVSTSSLDDSFNSKDRINAFIKTIEVHTKLNIDFLDLHVSNEVVFDNETFNTVCLDIGYYSGIEIENVFPGIKNVVHFVDNQDDEISRLIPIINKLHKDNLNSKRKLKLLKFNFSTTTIIMIICIVFYIVKFILSKKYDDTTALILCGSDYKMFTLGLKQFWRLLTAGFNHSSILHLVLNMYSFHYLGNYVENKFGSIKMLLILITSVILGSLTFGILSDNSLSCGLSGGIYGLLFIYIMDALAQGAYRDRYFIFMIIINLYLNFQPNVAWQAHLGGLIGGLIYYYMFVNNKVDYRLVSLLLVLLIALNVKYFTIKEIYPTYGGTDLKVVEAINDLGFIEHSQNLLTKLYNYYK